MLTFNKEAVVKKSILYCVVILLFGTARVGAQDGYTERAKKYVTQYYQLAIAEQRNSGVPAAVTLGQGILETEAGASELMTQANNHFGIKCKNGWDGETFLHDDDAKQECFKKYKSADESYRDHSYLLKRNPRYSTLFSIPMKDYASWAAGLKRCGYATDPQYAKRLVKIIEDFGLQDYTLNAMDSSKSRTELMVASQQTPTPKQPLMVDKLQDTTIFVLDPKEKVKEKDDEEEEVEEAATPPVVVPSTTQPVAIVDTVTTPRKITPTADTMVSAEPTAGSIRAIADSARNMITHNNDTLAIPPPAPAVLDTNGIVKIHGLKAFYAHKDEMLLQYAMQYNIRYPKLLEINDLADGPIPCNSYIFLEKKPAAGVNARHIVAAGESLWLIAQEEAIQLKRLTALNLMSADETPEPGTVLQLQFPASKKPDVKVTPTTAHKANAIVLINQEDKAAAIAKDSADYIPLKNAPDTAGIADGFIHNTDTSAIVADKKTKTQHGAKTQPKPKTAALPIPPAPQPLPEKSDAVVIITPNAPADKNAPTQWVTTDTVKKEIPAPVADENEEYQKKQELAGLKSQLDKVVYADDSKLVATIQSEQPAQKQDEQPAKDAKFYTVKKGDTAYSIAKKNNITVSQLLKWNDIDTTDIKAGKKLKISN
jgi:LysM repeat protein